MIYIDKKFLSIYDTNCQIDWISLEKLKPFLCRKINNVIYFTSKDVLYGIITSGDIRRAVSYGLGEVCINRTFTKVLEKDYVKALEIFKEKQAIHAIPVLCDDILIGEYNRRDAILPLMEGLGLEKGVINQVTNTYKRIAIVICDETVSSKMDIAKKMHKLLVQKCEKVDIIYGAKVLNIYEDYDICITLDEDDSAGLEALGYIFEKEDFVYKKNKAYSETMELAEAVDETLNPIKSAGINIVNLHISPENSRAREFETRINRKYSSILRNAAMTNELSGGFFQELDSEEYREHVGSEKDIVLRVKNGIGEIEDIDSKYRNYRSGERLTIGQPDNPEKTIYFFGQCVIRGAYVEDKDTIESILQKELNDQGYHIKVVNYGDCDPISTLRRIRIYFNERRIKPGDIVVTCVRNCFLPGIVNLNLIEKINFDDLSEAWFVDDFFHCNRKVNSFYAKELLSCLEEKGWLENKEQRESEIKLPDLLFHERYFSDIDMSNRDVGAIVMNCNPFTYGHRYLIEKSKAQVDLLVIFVVSEDKSLFSFNSRYAMVKAGTRDIENVVVIPSGDNVLSQRNFPEYFIKSVDEDTEKNAEKDIEIFARDIAPHLNISKRFVGEELTDEVTRHYNDAMKKILPKYGIELVEIPRKEIEGRPISATTVRACLTNNDMERLKRLCPQSTLDIMFWENK